MKSKTALLTAAGLLLALIAFIFCIFDLQNFGLAFLSLAIAALLVIAGVTHRYLVKVARDFRRQRPTTQNVVTKIIQSPISEPSSLRGEETLQARKSQGIQSQTAHTSTAPEGLIALKPVGNSLEIQPFLGGIAPTFEYAERASKNPGKLETFALRSKSSSMRDVFARAATNLHYNRSELVTILRAQRMGMLPGVTAARQWNPKLLLTLARTIANQPNDRGDLEDAEVIFNAAEKVFGKKVLGRSDIYIYAEVLQRLGMSAQAHRFLKNTNITRRDNVHVSLVKLNAISEKHGASSPEWQDALNSLFAEEQLAPITLSHEKHELHPLDQLAATSTPRSVDGPMISVIVPSYEGSRYIETTLDCLYQQTWKNIEVIVVDDGSSTENFKKLEEIIDRFPSDFKLVRQEENLGAYPARNRALRIACGDFITVHDDDDWSHPQKLEIQAKHLMENPKVPGNMTRHARATEDLFFTRINNNPSYAQPNFSSLMVRKSIFTQIGTWDEVNRGADAEFRDRLVQLTGRPVEVLLKTPLSFTRTHEASLTAGEINRGYIDPSRLFYQASYQAAHDSLNEGQLDFGFARPKNLMPGLRGKNLGHYDAVFATDFSFPGGTSTLTLNEIETAANAGFKVGMLHLFSPLNAGSTSVTPRALELAKRPDIDVLSLSDELDTDLLLVRHLSVLQFADNLHSNFTTQKGVVVVNNPPILKGGKGYGADVQNVAENFKAIFGIIPEIRAESGLTRSLLTPLTHSNRLTSELWPGFLDLSSIKPRRPIDTSKKPVVGRHTRDNALKWPSALQTYRDVYRSNDVFDVKVMGGIQSLSPKAQEIVSTNAEVIPFNGLPVSDFLDDLDFWVYFHSDKLTESFGMATVEAMAKGLVVILPHYMEENFGRAAVYAEPHEVRDVVSSFWSNPDKYEQQSNLARQIALSNFGKNAFLERLSAASKNG